MLLGRVVEPGEPLWLDSDRAEALAYMNHLDVERAERCPDCGTKPEDWVDERGRDLAEPALIVDISAVTSCPGCKAVEAARNQHTENGHDVSKARISIVHASPMDFVPD